MKPDLLKEFKKYVILSWTEKVNKEKARQDKLCNRLMWKKVFHVCLCLTKAKGMVNDHERQIFRS